MVALSIYCIYIYFSSSFILYVCHLGLFIVNYCKFLQIITFSLHVSHLDF